MVHAFLHLCHILDVPELSLSANCVFVAAPTEPPKNVARFLLATDFNQPSWGLWEKPNNDKQEE